MVVCRGTARAHWDRGIPICKARGKDCGFRGGIKLWCWLILERIGSCGGRGGGIGACG